MKFSIGKDSLATELGLLQGVVERKATIPILTNVLLQTEGSQVTLIATDLDVSLQTVCDADVSQPGAVVVNARKLLDIVRSLPGGTASFETEDGDWVRITSGSSKFRIVAQAKEHFPSIPQPAAGGDSFRADVLNSLITRTIFAITQEESRYALGGALLLITAGKALMVTTDGHRLALSSCQLDATGEDTRVIIPRKALSELQRLSASAPDSTVRFSRDENHLFFEIGRRKFTSRMLAGQFPNYEMVIPKGNDKLLTVNADKISQVIKRVALMADERSHGIKFDFGDGQLTMTSQTADMGDSTEVLEIEYRQGDVTLRFNANYLLDFLGVVDTDQLVIEMKDATTPVIFRPSEGSKYSYEYVVMPMRI